MSIVLPEKLKLRTENIRELTHLELDQNQQFVANSWSPLRKYKEGMIVYVASDDLSITDMNTGLSSYSLSWWRANSDHGPNAVFDISKWDPIGAQAVTGEISVKDDESGLVPTAATLLDFGDNIQVSMIGNTAHIDVVGDVISHWQTVSGGSEIYYLDSVLIGSAAPLFGHTENLQLVGSMFVSNNINLGGLIDGVDLAYFYSKYNSHKHYISNSLSDVTNNLTHISDVQISGLSNGHVLTYNSMLQRWVNQAPAIGSHTLSSHSDVSLSSLTLNNFLVFNGTNWVNLAILPNSTTGLTTPLSHNHNSLYYTITQLQTPGLSSVDWNNIINAPIGAADDEPYLLAAAPTSTSLSDYRIISSDSTISITDPGAGGNLILSVVDRESIQKVTILGNATDYGSHSYVDFIDTATVTFTINETLGIDHAEISAEVSGFLPLSGGAMTGDISFLSTNKLYYDKSATQHSYLQFYSAGVAGAVKLCSTWDTIVESCITLFTPGVISIKSTELLTPYYSEISVQSQTINVVSTYSSFVGLIYSSDYSANYVDRSLVDKEYVDTHIAGIGTYLTTSGHLSYNGEEIAWLSDLQNSDALSEILINGNTTGNIPIVINGDGTYPSMVSENFNLSTWTDGSYIYVSDTQVQLMTDDTTNNKYTTLTLNQDSFWLQLTRVGVPNKYIGVRTDIGNDNLILETANNFELYDTLNGNRTYLSMSLLTTDRTYNLPDASGTLLLDGQLNSIFTEITDGHLGYSGKVIAYTDDSNIITTTYSQLYTLIQNDGLIPGQQYLITDYATAYNIFDGGTNTVIEEQIGAVEELIVHALTTNTLEKIAYSTLYPQDIIYYEPTGVNVTTDIAYSDGAGTLIPNFKGVIEFRHDTKQNVSTWYDFRNIKFRRWAVDAVAYNSATAYVAKDVAKSSNGNIYKCILATTGGPDPSGDAAHWILWLDITPDPYWSWTSDKTSFNIGDINTDNLIFVPATYQDVYTFGSWYNHVNNVTIDHNNLTVLIAYGYNTTLNNIVFKTTDAPYTCYSNEIGEVSYNNTIGNAFYSNTIGNNFYSNTVGNNFNYNTIGNDFYSNTIGYSFSYSTVGNAFNSNTIGNSFSYSTIGYGFSYNTIGNTFNYNTIGNNFYLNTIENDFGSNIIGNSFSTNTIGDSFSDNIIENDFSRNTIGNGFSSNIIGNNSSSNTIGDSFSYNTIGNDFLRNTVGDSFSYNTIGNEFSSNTIGDGFSYNTIGNMSSVSGGIGCQGNSIGDFNDQVTLGDNCTGISIGEKNGTITLGATNTDISIGNGNTAVTIGDDCIGCTIGNGNEPIVFGASNSNIFVGNGNVITIGASCLSIDIGESNTITLGTGCVNLTFLNGCVFSTNTAPNGLQNTIFESGTNITATDFTSATFIKAAYNTTVFTNAASAVKLRYFDALDELTVVAVNAI